MHSSAIFLKTDSGLVWKMETFSYVSRAPHMGAYLHGFPPSEIAFQKVRYAKRNSYPTGSMNWMRY